ncbi:MAG: GNAT family N-acetyltransferase [Oscillospiraceae bacterium]|nr:GNAT family N-acetyltransferase [Oscillospiraceae bacterium]
MAEILYRSAEEADAAAIVAFYNQVGGQSDFLSFGKDQYPLDADAQAAAIRKQKNDPTNLMLLAIDNGEIAGIATIGSSPKTRFRHSGELGIVVAQTHWNRGIGSQMIAMLLKQLRAGGITTRVFLSTRADNPAAALYQRFGFAEEGRGKNAVLEKGVYHDLIWMSLML